MLYTLMSISFVAAGKLEQVQETHLTEAECIRKAKYYVENLYDAARCRPEQPTDSKAMFTLPSGRVIKLEPVNGVWIFPSDLLPSDRALVEELIRQN